MSTLNIGTEGVQACAELRTSPQWTTVRLALLEITRKTMNSALDASPENQPRACGYAQAMRDLFVAFESATSGTNINQVAKPGPAKRHQGDV